MKEQEAKLLVEKTFSQPFSEEGFRILVRNLLSHLHEFDHSLPYQTNVGDAYKDRVSRFKRIGSYSDCDGRKLDILVVYLSKNHSLDRARSAQRNFVADLLKKTDYVDAALVAFCVEGVPFDWRFSFVRMEYSSSISSDGRVKVTEEITPARRYSFLVGPGEPNHTALQSLWPLLTAEKGQPRVSDIEKAFDIESVTREFFEQYKELFLALRDEIDHLTQVTPRIAKEFQSKSIDVASFSKKLLGQIVFLYFLQKKGWLGVQRDTDGTFKPWGTGPKDFLQRLFRNHATYQNFFNDVLEPLFYEALAIERSDDYYGRFVCRIPFLNGGLFEPMNGYNWQEVDIPVSNAIFARIFETFNRFNFTVREDEPLDKEVAVDPEMLGKVFENLLEVKDRRSKGAFYTPREIVHYMCQESLIQYLVGQVSDLNPDDVEYFVRHGQGAVDNEAARAAGSQSYKFRMPKIMASARELDEALSAIRICDPAIGSGAFPVGLLSEIVNARQTLSAYLGASSSRTLYKFKHHAITQSIYGVDIDDGAVEIAKLRLWLSLVVDEDDFETIRPLPNLDFKVVRGNSLQAGINDSLNTHLVDEVQQLKAEFLCETRPGRKKDLRRKIDEKIHVLTGGRDIFDFSINFSEVFSDQSGFDVVIANPPYVRHEGIKEQKVELAKAFGGFFCGTADLYTFFYKRGLEILRPAGHLCFISPNKFTKASYGKKTRSLLGYEYRLKKLVDFCELPVFDAATDPAIVLVQKSAISMGDKFSNTVIKSPEGIRSVARTVADNSEMYRLDSLSVDGWVLGGDAATKLLDKMKAGGTMLGDYVSGRFYYGIKTGLNEAFVIDEATRERLIAEDPRSAELIRPWVDGHDLKRWSYVWKHKYLIAIASSANRNWPWSSCINLEEAYRTFSAEFPSVSRHLSAWRLGLMDRDDQGKFWWELRSCSYWNVFDVPRLVFNETSKELHAYVAHEPMIVNKTGFVIVSEENEFLLGILNSSLLDFYFRSIFPPWGDPWKGGRIQFRKDRMVNVPIPLATARQKESIAELVRTIQSAPESKNVTDLERRIDSVVLDLYGVSEHELVAARNHVLN